MLRAEGFHRKQLNHLMCGNDDVDALEYIIPYPLFGPELDIVGSRKHPCLKCRQLGRQSLMLLDGQGDRWNAEPDQLQRTSEDQMPKKAPTQ